MTIPVEKRNASKFYEFHGEVGHTTDECMHLKRQIKEMLKAGKVSHLIKELKQSNGKNQAEASVISFPPLGEEDRTKGPMIIEVEMGGHFVYRMYVDGGSSLKILYEHCFNRFSLEVRSQMVPASTPLIGFSGEILWPLEQILLLVKIGDEEHSTSAWINSMVLRSPSPYNEIIGRPGVRRIQTVPSTTYGMLKFLVTGGMVILRSSRIISLECRNPPKVSGKTIAIGSTLTEEGRTELCGLLRRNLDVFTWKPADMTGVPRHIAEHMLNIREGCLPVRQKKRGQAPERNKAIHKEVEKLVNAGIMKEVHYHSWLSNSVIVKKHDDSWRMCVDFKNLNKACPNDDYPIPEIDWKKCTKKTDFQWTAEAETAFKQMKKLIADFPMLTTPKEKEELIIYLAAAKEAISIVLMTKRDGKQVPIYFVSRALQGLEINYSPMEKLILALVTGRLLKWSFKLEEHDIHYRPRTSVKGQILADFIMERLEDDPSDTPMEDKEELLDPWILFTDGSSYIDDSEAGLILTNPEGAEFTYALRFRFKAINNEAKYEALIAGLRIAEQTGIKNL
ncbi:reverse transcriptase domain-containing protein [Tanacetum coccineum]|uniref:Reverse transcriptase domain-containing protein n=1 Tax=Tanacetum coccineum TaxID=301880 RepID=A0ABQ4YJ85_9ASTR